MLVTGFADCANYCPYCGERIVFYNEHCMHEAVGYKCLSTGKVFFVIEGEEDDSEDED